MNDLNVNNVTKNDEKIYNPDMTILKEIPIREETLFKKLLKNIVKIFDLSLFKDPIYINIMIGMSLAIFAELNFSLLTPFILADLNLTTSQIAMFLSSLSIADLCFRFLAPFIGDYLNQPARIMYSISLIFLIITRFSKYFLIFNFLSTNVISRLILYRFNNGRWLFSINIRFNSFRYS